MAKKIVPETPTSAMITAGGAAIGGLSGPTDDEAAEAAYEAMVAAASSADTDLMDAAIGVTRTTPGIVSVSPASYLQSVLELRQAILGVSIPGPGPKS